jgi:hypothetical protein
MKKENHSAIDCDRKDFCQECRKLILCLIKIVLSSLFDSDSQEQSFFDAISEGSACNNPNNSDLTFFKASNGMGNRSFSSPSLVSQEQGNLDPSSQSLSDNIVVSAKVCHRQEFFSTIKAKSMSEQQLANFKSNDYISQHLGAKFAQQNFDIDYPQKNLSVFSGQESNFIECFGHSDIYYALEECDKLKLLGNLSKL